jgi:4-amino-4-deoxy-L-arabinose transferase-like glycosyltransferase
MTLRFCVVVLSIVVYGSNLGGFSIYILDEAKNASCAMEMMQRDDLIVPTFNGKLRTDKPPLHYYFMIASYKVFGVTPLAARFFSFIAGIFLLVLTYLNVKKLVSESVAFYTSLVLLSSLQLAIQFHLAVPDPYLIFLLCAGLFSVFNGLQGDRRQLYLFYVAIALAFLTKGLVAVVLPGLIVLIYLILQKDIGWSMIRRLKIIEGVVIFCVIALPWYIAVGKATDGAWLKGFFIEHNFDRYTSTMEGHRGFPLAPFVIMVAALLPFSVFVVQAVKLSFQSKNPFLLFCLVVCLVFGVFFSFSQTILPSYPAPAVPFLAIVIGYYLDYWIRNFEVLPRMGLWIGGIVNIVVALAICLAIYVALAKEPELASMRYLSVVFIVIPVGAAIGWYFGLKAKPKQLIYFWAGSWILTSILFFCVAFPPIDMRNPVSESAAIIEKSEYSERRVIGYKLFNPAMVFELKKTIEVFDSPDQLKSIMSSEKVLLITRQKYIQELPFDSLMNVLYRGKDLFERNETVVLVN